MTYISAKRRHKAATVRVKGKEKFPIDSHHTAESAIHLINNAKPPLTPSQKSNVRRRAATYGVTSSTEKSKKKN